MITFIYFDVGGVIIRDFSGTGKWQDLKRELGVVSQTDITCFDRTFYPLETESCRGKRTIDSVLPVIGETCGLSFPENYSLLNGFVSRFEPNNDLAALLPKLKRYRRGLLTDMYPGMLQAIRDHGIMSDVAWDMIIDSSVTGYRKPDAEQFRIAEKRAGVPGNEILLVENKLSNVEAARKFGWEGFLYDPTDTAGSTRALARFLHM